MAPIVATFPQTCVETPLGDSLPGRGFLYLNTVAFLNDPGVEY